jgi:hypothetical protein
MAAWPVLPLGERISGFLSSVNVRFFALMPALLLVATATAAAQTAPVPPAADATEIAVDKPVTLPVAQGSAFQLRVVTGDIRVTRAPGPDVIVNAVRDPGADEPRLDMIDDENGLTLCTVYSSPNPKKPNECLPKGKGRLNEGIRKDSPRITLNIALPDGVRLFAHINIGNITSAAGASDLNLRSDFGNISIVDHGSKTIYANIVTKGDLTAQVSPVDYKYDRTIDLTCAYGKMRVYIDENLPIDYRISAYTTIETPFHLARPVSYTRTGKLHPDSPANLQLNLDALAMFAQLYLLPLPRR